MKEYPRSFEAQRASEANRSEPPEAVAQSIRYARRVSKIVVPLRRSFVRSRLQPSD